MSEKPIELLVVDDEAFNREILEERLSDAGYRVTLAVDGEDAWRILETEQQHFSVILLDRTMPRLNGIGLLVRMKADARFAKIPVIFQTAVASPADIAEGIKSGCYYYLVKPLNLNVLFAIVRSAVGACDMSENAGAHVAGNYSDLLRHSEFQLRTLSEARTLAHVLSNFYPQPQRVILGISELLINAVEHGNLGISYQEKTRLLHEGRWEDEIEDRLSLPENTGKMVTVRLEHGPHEIRLTINDCGAGFESSEYMVISPVRAFDPNGRGIAMSRSISFDTLEYKGSGSQLVAVVKI